MNHTRYIEHMMKNYIKKYKGNRDFNNPYYLSYLFEYYSAIHLSKKLDKNFFVYNDIKEIKNSTYNFPKRDYGIDLIDSSLDIIGQCKYYSNNRNITYRNLSTFLSSDKLIGKQFKYYIIRTDESRLDKVIQKIIDRGELNDICISKKEFLSDIFDISNNQDSNQE